MPKKDSDTPEFEEAFDRFEEDYEEDFESFQKLLDAFTLWGGKHVIPTAKQEKALRDTAIERNKIEDKIITSITKKGNERQINLSYVVTKDVYIKGIIQHRLIDIKTGKYVSKADYEKQFDLDE